MPCSSSEQTGQEVCRLAKRFVRAVVLVELRRFCKSWCLPDFELKLFLHGSRHGGGDSNGREEHIGGRVNSVNFGDIGKYGEIGLVGPYEYDT